jgi:hypothetical protein
VAIELFGFRIGKIDDAVQRASDVPSFAPPSKDDGAVEISPGGAYGTFVDLEGTAKTEGELVTRYREISMQPEAEAAIDDIVNEAIVVDDTTDMPVSIELDELKASAGIKSKIQDEFETILELLDFQNLSYEIFKRWYVDGRLYYHMMIDKNRPRDGLQELRYIDPRRIRKVRIPVRQKPMDTPNRIPVAPAYSEYYQYNPTGFGTGTQLQGVKVSPDSICYVHSGMLDQRNKMVLSNLHKAIKPINQLRMLEDAVVIYRLSRAPERRIFYIDVGNLPKMKAEQYLRDMMVKHKNRLVYDAVTGEVRDDRKFMTMLEDFWLPRREGGRGTEITTLPGGQNLGEMEDVNYFRKKLYKALNVPISRIEPETGFNLGRPSEITRDELKFTKFIKRLRHRFSHLFDTLLETQLALKGVMTKEEWATVRNSVKYKFSEDNHFSELKDQELINSRIAVLQTVDPFVGRYVSEQWVRTNVLRQSDDDIERIKKEISDEGSDQAALAAQQGGQPGGAPAAPPAAAAAPPTKPTPTKEDWLDFKNKPLSEEDKRLVENMTTVLDELVTSK